MSRYIVTDKHMDPDVIKQLKQMDPSLEVILDDQNILHQHEQSKKFWVISNFFDEFCMEDHVITDVIRYRDIDDVMLATMLSDHKFTIIDISDDDLDELVSMTDCSNLEKFQDLIRTLDNLRGKADDACDYGVEGALEKILNVIDKNLDKVQLQLEDVRYHKMYEVESTWCHYFHKLAA